MTTEVLKRQVGAEIEPWGPPPTAITYPGGLLTRELVDQIKEQVGFLKELKMAVLAITSDDDWCDLGGKPYPKDSAIHAIATAIGLEFGEPAITKDEGKDSRGQWMRFRCALTGTWRGQRLSDIGTSSTRDPFFGRAHNADVPFEDIDIGNVEKNAVTNAQHRVLAKKFGLGAVTWEDLETAGVVTRRGAGGMARFKGQEKRHATGADEWTPEKEELWGLLLELNENDEKKAADALFAATEDKAKGFAGKRDPRTLTLNQVRYHLPRARAEYTRRSGDAAAPERVIGSEG